MLNKIITYSIKNKLIVGLFVVSLIGWGAFQVTQLPIDAVPDITDNQVQVITVSPSLGATDIERLVTFPIEQACSSIPGTKQIRSFSRFGLSLITIVFEDKIDIYWARQQISEKLQKVQQDIPPGTGTPELAPVSTGLGEIFQYVVRPLKGYESKFDAMELRTIQDWIVRRQLIGTPGVAEVASFGGKLKQYEISVRQDQLKSYGLTISDIFSALEKNNQNTGGAYIEKGPTVLYIRSEGLTVNIDDIEKIVVKQMSNGNPLLIRDIAKVQLGAAIRYGAMTYNAEGEVAGAVVMMLKGENSSLVVKRVKDKIAEIQKMLPEGVVIEPFLDRTKMVNNAIKTVETNLLEGALIVIFVLVFFLGNLRAGLIVSSVIPLSMLFAIILMNLFGVGGNLMSLGAIDFGLIVDGSVIVVEAILHRFAHSKHFRTLVRIDQGQMDEEVGKSTGSMIKSAVFSQIIILIVYIPILSLEGIEGKMFKPMAFTIAFAIFGAFILSITYVPMMAALFLNKKLNHKKNITDRLMIWLERSYQPFLKMVLKIPKTVIGVTVLLFFVSVGLLMNMGGEFIPQLEEGDFAVETRVLSGGSINTTLDATQKASKLLIDRFPEVEKIVTKIGAGEIPTDPMTMDASDLIIILKDKEEWVSANTFDALADTMGKVMSQVPGITSGFQYPVQMRFNELMTGSRQDVSCKIFGENLDSLAKYAALMGNIINDVEGAKDLYTETVTGISQVVIHFNRAAIARYGANIKEVNQVIQSAYAGGVAGKVFEGDRRFDLVVRLNNIQKKDWQQIKNLMVTVGNNKQVPLYELAEVRIEEGPYQIQREDAARRIVVGFNVRGKDVKTVVNEVQEKVKKSIQFPPGYYVVYGGQFENLEHAVSRLQIAVPGALLLILVMLFFAFNNLKHCLLIFSAIPFSAIGGVLALWLRGMPFSISAGVGFIALFGVAVLNGIVLLTEMNKLAMEPNRTIVDIIATATKTRLRPILITAAVASLGFIPMALSSGAGAEVQKPLATVVIGGLLSATLLTLFVLPIFYQLFEKKRLGQTTIAILFCIIGLNATALQAQELTVKKPLAKVFEQAMLVSPTLKTTEAQRNYYQALSKSSFDPAKLEFRGEIGNVNSSLNDSKYAVEQVFDLPKVYQAQKNLNLSISQTYSYQAILDEKLIHHAVEQLYIQLQFQVAKGLLLGQLDSIYAKQLAAVDARFKAGQDNGLEQLNMQNWVSLHKQLMIQHQNEQLGLQKQFVILLQDPSLLLPADGLKFEPRLLDTVIDASHPINLLWMQKLQSAIAETNVAKSKILPQVAMGYTNQSFRMNPEDANRYNSVNLGLNIPLFRSGLKQKVKASQANETVIMHEKDKALLDLNMQIQKAWSNYQQTMDLYQHIQKGLIPNAAKMATMANLSFKEGQISYIEWSNAMSQVQQIQMQALESLALFNLNQSTLYYLLSK